MICVRTICFQKNKILFCQEKILPVFPLFLVVYCIYLTVQSQKKLIFRGFRAFSLELAMGNATMKSYEQDSTCRRNPGQAW